MQVVSPEKKVVSCVHYVVCVWFGLTLALLWSVIVVVFVVVLFCLLAALITVQFERLREAEGRMNEICNQMDEVRNNTTIIVNMPSRIEI